MPPKGAINNETHLNIYNSFFKGGRAGLRGGPKGPGSQAPHQKGPTTRSVDFLNTIVLFAMSIEYNQGVI